MDRHRAIRMSGDHPRGHLQLAALVAEHEHLAIRLLGMLGIREIQRHRGRGADQGRIVPGELRQRLGQFLEPAIIGEPPVPDGRVGAEHDLQEEG